MSTHSKTHTVRSVSGHLDVTPATVRSWIKQGRILAHRLETGTYRIPQSEIDRLLGVRPKEARRG